MDLIQGLLYAEALLSVTAQHKHLLISKMVTPYTHRPLTGTGTNPTAPLENRLSLENWLLSELLLLIYGTINGPYFIQEIPIWMNKGIRS